MDVHDLALRGEKESLRALLNTGCDVNATDNWEMTPLMWAAQMGNTECVQLLLERGADACKSNSSGRSGHTAVHCAITGGHLEVLRLLLASAQDPVTLGPLFITLSFMVPNTACVSFALACGCPLEEPSDVRASVLRPIICCYYSLSHLL